ncbi:MAG: cytidine deaminase [Sphingobium sp.]|jgi:cytidine deaminase|nr:cytidine deaminase [Sphingobium sp.]MCP5398858.1 cytidine deaminase [Sphingomonas sp.]
MTEAVTLDDALMAAARAARNNAYAPYSRFAVGAALRLTDGSIIRGSNFENASYGLSLCAETVAVATANSMGKLGDIVAIAISGSPETSDDDSYGSPVTPCGRCRQILAEVVQLAGRDIPVYCDGGTEGQHAIFTVAQLLPHAFSITAPAGNTE